MRWAIGSNASLYKWHMLVVWYGRTKKAAGAIEVPNSEQFIGWARVIDTLRSGRWERAAWVGRGVQRMRKGVGTEWMRGGK